MMEVLGRHGIQASVLLNADVCTHYPQIIEETIEMATGQRPRGWLGPAVTETFQTPSLLAELGLSYVLDWTNDDQPYRVR
ncbi:hypothetical protein [Nonomuraea polychroma]|uniref:hypothetical protein n=1 Tax=Nonomuraea polychroma TaxID=46176 RepID=UPI0019D47B4C|nr:hypothetical protein [Nonomuraea polychroma]